ncbi:hypothetical protein RRG08_038315 [Elysia crispata]|uniref:LIM zinc-binding domain-containing protein n=1 Tax=Elysia crispata TaxID=231223 RepID=A0AAE1ANH5_9GAST|nr:hypothetical protein RRG08_038315 [Elysia crispata]
MATTGGTSFLMTSSRAAMLEELMQDTQSSDNDSDYGGGGGVGGGATGGREDSHAMPDVCHRCGGRVYPVERVDVGALFHRRCFRCKICGLQLSLRTFNWDQSNNPPDIYCQAHMPRHVGSIDSQAVGIKTAIGAPKRGVALSEQYRRPISTTTSRHQHQHSISTSSTCAKSLLTHSRFAPEDNYCVHLMLHKAATAADYTTARGDAVGKNTRSTTSLTFYAVTDHYWMREHRSPMGCFTLGEAGTSSHSDCKVEVRPHPHPTTPSIFAVRHGGRVITLPRSRLRSEGSNTAPL